ncbi:MAG: hypothetical protein Q8M20_05250 [Rhodocyclaceae bacterium]|nr:hypothetical protein [Rhodocyclaceae bacterium]MDZ4214168.1 hypothetical protein [Rhodocyclaceae bacterium]
MRTTLDIDNDVLTAAKELARQQNLAIGKIVSRMLREAISGKSMLADAQSPVVAGFRPFPVRGSIVTDEAIDKLRDTEGI